MSNQLFRFEACFTSNQLQVLRSENLFERPQGLGASVLEFLELDELSIAKIHLALCRWWKGSNSFA